jgi:hypothetical protein
MVVTIFLTFAMIYLAFTEIQNGAAFVLKQESQDRRHTKHWLENSQVEKRNALLLMEVEALVQHLKAMRLRPTNISFLS